MHRPILPAFVIAIFVLFLAGCAPAATPIPPTLTPIPTNTLQPLTATPITPTETQAPPTDTPIPPTYTPATTPIMIMASDAPIKIGDFVVELKNVQISDTGWNPFGLPSNLALNIDFEAVSGKLEDFVNLRVWFTDALGNTLDHTASEIGKDPQGITHLTWHVWISEPAKVYFINFPTGEVIDLSPLLNK